MSRLLLYYGGELRIADEFTPSYIGGRNRPLLVGENISLSMLKERVMRALRIDSTSNTVNLICRLRNNGGYCATHINDDEVCEFILMEGRSHTVVVYVEVEEICIEDAAAQSNQYEMPDPTPNIGHEGNLRYNIDMVEDIEPNDPHVYPSFQNDNNLSGSHNIENDNDDGYRTMDSGNSHSSDDDPEQENESHERMLNDLNDDNNGDDLIATHARQNVDGIESMVANNEFVQTLKSTQQWDADERFDAPVSNIVSSSEANIPNDLYEGQIFHNKEDLQTAINGWSIINNVQFITTTSNRSRFSIICTHHDNPHRSCLWRLHASRNKRLGGLWKVSTCGPPHSCTHPVIARGHHNLTSKYICRHITPLIRQLLDMKPKEIITRMESKFDMKISYMKAWDARRKAIEAIFGSYEHSYSNLLCFTRITDRWTGFNWS